MGQRKFRAVFIVVALLALGALAWMGQRAWFEEQRRQELFRNPPAGRILEK
jgi:hypothetical protein